MGRKLDPSTPFSSTMVGKLSSPTFNTHLANSSLPFRIGYHDSHVDMKTNNRNMLPKMWLRQWSNDNVFSSSLGNNRQDLSKIPTKDHSFPTKDLLACLCIIQLHQITKGLINNFESSTMHHRCLIPNDHISFTHQLNHFHMLCDVASRLIVQINRNLESWMGGFAAQKQQRCNSWWDNRKHDFALPS